MPPLLLLLVLSRIPIFGQPARKPFQPMLDVHLDWLETELASRDWFAGNEFTAADIMMSFPLEAARSRGGLNESRPHLIAGWSASTPAPPTRQPSPRAAPMPMRDTQYSNRGRLHAETAAEIATEKKGLSLQLQMLIGFVVGLVGGMIVHVSAPGAPWVETVTTYITGPVGQIFLRLLFMLVIPLLFSALVVGISEMGEIRSLKRVGLRTLLYTIVVSTIAVVVSLVVVNLLQPGNGVDPGASPLDARRRRSRRPRDHRSRRGDANRHVRHHRYRAGQHRRRDGQQRRDPVGDVLRAVLRHRRDADRHAQAAP